MSGAARVEFAVRQPVYTRHVLRRMRQRAISFEMLEGVMLFGRELRGPDTVMHVVGRREVACWRLRGHRIERLQGIHVVCSREGVVLTVYRNSDLRGARALKRCS